MHSRLLRYGGPLAVAILGFVLYSSVCDYVIVGQRDLPVSFFLFDSEFLREFLDEPGGLLHYGGRFLGQFYHTTWLGALVLSACITCFGILFHRVLRRLGPGKHVFHTLFPCFLLLALHASPATPIEYTLGLLTACAAFLGYLMLPRGMPRHLCAFVATPVLYLVVGGHVWLFVAWVIALEWLEEPLAAHLPFKLLYLVVAVLPPLVAYRWLYPISFRHAWGSRELLSVSQGWLGLGFSAYLLLVPVWARASLGARQASFWRSRVGIWAQLALVLVSAGTLAWLVYDPLPYEWLEYRDLYDHQDWQGILERARRDPHPQVMVQFFTNYALFRKGVLLDEMFHYPQPWGARGLFLNFSGQGVSDPAESDIVRALYSGRLLLEMGHANAALLQAFNHIAIVGPTYENLELMARCNMVNGSYGIAGKYLSLLEKTMFHRQFARYYRSVIADADAAERSFGGLRKRLPTVHGPIETSAEFGFLRSLVDSYPRNRMAFDYFIAWCLLKKGLMPTVAANVKHLRDAGYNSMPTHLQEGLLLLQNARQQPVDTDGFTFSAETISRVNSFLRQLQRSVSQGGGARDLEPAFSDTYMYYCFCILTPDDRRTGPAGGWRLGIQHQ